MNDLNHALLYLTGTVAFLAVATVVLYAIVEARSQQRRTLESAERSDRAGRVGDSPE